MTTTTTTTTTKLKVKGGGNKKKKNERIQRGVSRGGFILDFRQDAKRVDAKRGG